MMYISAHHWRWKSFPLHSVTPFLTVLSWFSHLHRNLWGEKCLYALSVQSLSCAQLFATPWTAVRQASLSITRVYSNSCPLSEWCHPTTLCRPLLHLPSIFPTIRVFSNEPVVCIKSPKHWSFSFNISPSSEYSGLISFRMDWLDLMQSKGSSRVSPAPQFKCINSLRLSIPGGSAGQESTCNAGDLGLISGLEKSSEKGTAIHSSILAWRIPWTI